MARSPLSLLTGGGAAQDLGLGQNLGDQTAEELDKIRKKRQQEQAAQKSAGPAASGSPAYMSLMGNQY